MAKILVADDNSNIQKMVGLALKDQGIDVVAVGNGEAAVRKISDVKPDLVLADVFMPVRNGYEVCRYVKQESGMSHIPVILLVGAFDPLDEQEAQRVGADGVLKKPFVPPDPLISMVKSALTRAGVPLGPPAQPEKGAPPSRSAADLLSSGAGSKLAELRSAHIPEATPEPVEDFPTPPPSVKIAAGTEPLAFGSLLETPEAEDEPIFQPKSPVELGGDKWSEERDEPEEEPEEEEGSHRGGWRPSALEEEPEPAASSSHAATDWREQAFHGSSPALGGASRGWPQSSEPAHLTEAAESPAVAVSTLETKLSAGPTPFTGDAWAAAMAAGVEEKLAEIAPTEIPAVEDTVAAETKAPDAELHHVPETSSLESAPSAQKTSLNDKEVAQPPSSWFSVPPSPWELEAKKATLLASTWDAPAAVSPDETQEVLPPVEESASPETVSDATTEVPGAEVSPAGASESAGIESAPARRWNSGWETPAPPLPSFDLPAGSVTEMVAPEPAEVPAYEPCETASAPEPQHAAAPSGQPDMDELVARVLGKMNPEVLQKVTREILKPVIEAIIRNELDSTK